MNTTILSCFINQNKEALSYFINQNKEALSCFINQNKEAFQTRIKKRNPQEIIQIMNNVMIWILLPFYCKIFYATEIYSVGLDPST